MAKPQIIAKFQVKNVFSGSEGLLQLLAQLEPETRKEVTLSALGMMASYAVVDSYVQEGLICIDETGAYRFKEKDEDGMRICTVRLEKCT